VRSAQAAERKAATKENRNAVAVIIGNGKYGTQVPGVDFAHNDADAMKRFVIDWLGYREGNIIDLRDATKAQLETVFGVANNHKGRLHDWVRADKSDVVVFYSGHGVPGLDDRRGYLLPVDADPDFVAINGYPVDLLFANLAQISARSITVFIDACFSGDTPEGLLIRATSGISVTPKLPAAGVKLTVLTAGQGDQMASWDEQEKHGLFTHYLLEGLRGAADGEGYGNGDGQVTLAEVKAYLDDEMTYQARRRFHRTQQASIMGDPDTVLVTHQ
jgi:uncharacterized caspase-like protein